MRPDTADQPPMRISDRIRILIPVLAVSLAVSACSIFEDDKPAYVEKPVDELYNRGVDLMGSRKYTFPPAITYVTIRKPSPHSIVSFSCTRPMRMWAMPTI